MTTPRKQRILLLGANGQLGHELQRALLPLGEVIPATRAGADLTQWANLQLAIDQAAPTVIVNAAAYTAVDKAESDATTAAAINAQAPLRLAQECKRRGIRLVHYSTDYVFDGAKTSADGWPLPYTEADPIAPHSVYGLTKAEGEQAVLESGCNHLVFRLSWVFGEHGGNFPKTMLKLARERDHLRVVADQHGCPTPAALAADITLLALHRGLDGLYHLSSSEPTTWHAFAQATLQAALDAGFTDLKVRPEQVQAITTAEYPTPAKRPFNSILDCGKLEADLGVSLPSWRPYLQRLVRALKGA